MHNQLLISLQIEEKWYTFRLFFGILSCYYLQIVVFLVIACSYFNERCDSLSSGDRILSLVSLMGDNLGTKIQKKYENRQKIRRERENINSHKIIDFSHFTDL